MYNLVLKNCEKRKKKVWFFDNFFDVRKVKKLSRTEPEIYSIENVVTS